MKKLTFIFAAMVVIALSSCSKEKDCECVTKATGEGSEYVDDITTSGTIEDGECSDANTSSTVGGLTVSTTCTEQ